MSSTQYTSMYTNVTLLNKVKKKPVSLLNLIQIVTTFFFLNNEGETDFDDLINMGVVKSDCRLGNINMLWNKCMNN